VFILMTRVTRYHNICLCWFSIYCHVFSDCRRGIGLSTGFIGSQDSYTLTAESLIITTDSHGILAITKLFSRLPTALLLELPSNWNSGTELNCWDSSQVKVTLRPTISRSVRLGFEPHLGLMTRC
jgi:hypothetical protein